MGLDFLTRVRKGTIVLAILAAIVAATYASPLAALGLLAGVAWSLANLLLIEKLVVTVITPGPAPAGAVRRLGWTLCGMAALLAAGAWLLFHLPALWLVAGFSLPLAVIVLKAGSRALLDSAAWRALVRSRWRAAAAVAVVILAAWWLVPSGSRGERAAAGPEAGQKAGAAAGDAGAHGAAAGDAGAHGEAAGAAAGSEAAHGDSAAHGTAVPADGHGGGAGGAHGDATGAAAGSGDAHGAGHGEAADEESGAQKFPNLITLLVKANHDAPWAHTLHLIEPILFAFAVGILLCVTGFVASRNPKMIPGGLQNGAETLVEKLYDFVGGILGPTHGRRFFPLLGSLFVYIFAMNLFGILPLMDSPTSNLNVTFALGLTVFVYVQYVGIRSLGVVGYVDHLLGNPRNVTGWALAPLMLPIHVLGELAKPISLSCRLFGNIFGEDMLMVGFATLGIGMLSFTGWPVGIPIHAVFFPLLLLTSTLQAFVFTVLSTIYILLMLPHEEHGHEEEAQHAH